MTDLPNRIRSHFPILNKPVNGKRYAYLDNGATTLKPLAVTQRIQRFYEEENATIHRGVYFYSQQATTLYDDARSEIARFINAKSDHEVIFTKGTTESINLVAFSLCQKFKSGQEIVISAMEHHANIVPWQEACKRHDLILKVIPMNQQGELILDNLDQIITEKTALVAIVHISNALGTINPVAEITKAAKKKGAYVLVDGAQSIAHAPVDVQALNCDFFCFSGHKAYGPTGIGVLYGKKDVLSQMPPYQTGGDMIETVTFEKTTFADIPSRFEAGTPAIAQAIGLGEAIRYIRNLGFEAITAHENKLADYAQKRLSESQAIQWIGQAKHKAAIHSFNLTNIHPHDVGTILDDHGVAVRVGHHCAQPVMQFFKVSATIRVSFGIYNSIEDIDQLVDALKAVQEIMG